MTNELKHSPIKGHSTAPRAEPKTVDEWQEWAETLQADMEWQAERIVELEKKIAEEQQELFTFDEVLGLVQSLNGCEQMPDAQLRRAVQEVKKK